MNKLLNKTLCYLIGPIDNDKELGVSYRKKIIKESKKRKLGIKFLDPTNKLVGLNEGVKSEYNKVLELKENEKYDELTEMVKYSIVRPDLRQVDVSDFLIAYIDPKVHMCGSYHEIVVATTQKKPVLLIVKGGKKKTPTWLFGILDHNLIFSTIEECLDYLDNLNKGKVKYGDKWVLFRNALENLV